MSTPYNGGGTDPRDPRDPNEPQGFEPYPEHPQGSHPENDYGLGQSGYGQEQQSQPGYPAYGDYPAYGQPGYEDYQDYSAFDVNSAAAMSGATALRFHGQQLTDNVPGDGQSPHPINDPASNGWFHTKGTGKLKLFDALGWGFKSTFSNAKLWLVVGLIYLVITVLLQFIPFVGGFLSSLAMIGFMPWVAGVALQQTLARDFTLQQGQAPAYGKTLGMAVIIGLITTILMTILLTVFLAGSFTNMDLTALPQSPEELETMTADEIFALIQPMLASLGLALLISLLVTPFFTMQVWYAADNNGSFGEAFGTGFKAGARNYLPLLGLTIVIVLINMVGAMLLGLGLIVTLPASTLALAHAYRQISAGPVPREA